MQSPAFLSVFQVPLSAMRLGELGGGHCAAEKVLEWRAAGLGTWLQEITHGRTKP